MHNSCVIPTALRSLSVTVFVIIATSCNPRPERDAPSRDSAAISPSSALSPQVFGACCPDTDAELTALMQRYETTPERERSPELALWPYRMTSGIPDQQRIV